MALSFEHSLTGTPLGRCVAGLVLERVKVAALAGRFAKSSLSYDFLSPRAK